LLVAASLPNVHPEQQKSKLLEMNFRRRSIDLQGEKLGLRRLLDYVRITRSISINPAYDGAG